MKQPLGVILAGGLSRRMGGGDKSLLTIGGAPMMRHVMDRLAPQVADVAINANGDAARFIAFDCAVISDSIDGYVGPLAGILAGLDWAAGQGADSIVTAAADTPFLPCDLVPRLILAADGMEAPLALAATDDGRSHPTFGLWPVALRDDLRAAIMGGVRKVSEWADRHKARTAVFAGDTFFNVNTPDDLIIAEQMLKAKP